MEKHNYVAAADSPSKLCTCGLERDDRVHKGDTRVTPQSLKTCAGCRHSSTDKRPKVIDATGFDDQLMFEDEDEIVYTCRGAESEHNGKTIGTTPITCAAFEVPVPKEMSEVDRLIAAREERTREKT